MKKQNDKDEILEKPKKEKKPKEPKAPKEKKPKEPKAPKEKKPKEPKVPKEKKPKEPKVPKEKKPKEPKVPKEKKPKEPKVPKEKKPKEPKAPKEKKVKDPNAKKEFKLPKLSKLKLPKFLKKTNAEGEVKEPKEHKILDKIKNSKFGVSFVKGCRFVFNTKKIRTVIVGSFLVPVVFIIVLGVTSYKKASKTIISNYQDSAVNTISAQSMYLQLLCDTVSSKAAELVMEQTMSSYYKLYYADTDSEAMQMVKTIKDNLRIMANNADYISGYYVAANEGTQMSSEDTPLPDDTYTAMNENGPDGAILSENQKVNMWLGYHTYIDSVYSDLQTKYGLTYYQRFMSAKAVLILDVDMETIDNALGSIDFGENSYKAIVTRDGREIIVKDVVKEGERSYEVVNDNIFFGKSFYDSSLESEEAGYKEVKIDGDKYLYVYAPVGKTGIMICSLIPYSNMIAEVAAIRSITVGVVMLAIAVAMIVGSLIAINISKTLKVTVDALDKVAEGDLTVTFETKRKDEFKMLCDGLNHTLSGIRELMTNVSGFGSEVNQLSYGVAETSDTINNSMQDISAAIEEVSKGVVMQAEETETCNTKMTDFSEQIGSVCDEAENMGGVADKAIDAVNKGKVIIEDLSEQSEITVRLTKQLGVDILNVNEQSDEIESIINVINDIADQTSLLSLNASIEAARAGENGRGFAVVADEIRKLAEQSAQAGNQIKDIVANIKTTTQQTTDSAQKAESYIYKQADSLEATIVVFGLINNCVDELVKGINHMAVGMRGIGEEKEDVEDAITNISAVAEEAAAATEEVTATLNEQVTNISYLTDKAEELATRVHALEEAMSQFKI